MRTSSSICFCSIVTIATLYCLDAQCPHLVQVYKSLHVSRSTLNYWLFGHYFYIKETKGVMNLLKNKYVCF